MGFSWRKHEVMGSHKRRNGLEWAWLWPVNWAMRVGSFTGREG